MEDYKTIVSADEGNNNYNNFTQDKISNQFREMAAKHGRSLQVSLFTGDPIMTFVKFREAEQKISNILTGQQLQILLQFIPARFRERTLTVCFTTEKDGFSLLSLFNHVKQYHPLLLLLQTKNAKIIGAYLTHPLSKSKSFYGTGETFIFSIKPYYKVWKWDRANRQLFIYTGEDKLIIGGGEGTAISIDNELWRGLCESCTTYNNVPLTGKRKTFEISKVELFRFV